MHMPNALKVIYLLPYFTEACLKIQTIIFKVDIELYKP
jgi:hypothetical protein